MKLSSAHKAQLSKVTRVALAGAMVVGSVSASFAAPADAVALQKNRTLISDSRLSSGGGTGVTYTIEFWPATSVTAIKQVNVMFCTQAGDWTDTCTAPSGMAVPASMVGATATGFGGGTSAGATFTQTAANAFNLVWTTPAAETNIEHEMVLTNLITNSDTQGTYYTRVRTYSDTGTTAIDDGTSAFAIVNRVNVTGRVLESLTFSVAQVNSGVVCGLGDTANVTSTTTAVPFGNFNTGSPRIGCQTVTTATNAVTGYTTTIKEVLGGASPIGGMCRQTSTGCSTNGADNTASASDVIVDVSLDATPGAWVNSTDFGLGVSANGTEKHTDFAGNASYRSLFGATPIAIATAAGPTNGNATHVVFKADVQATQTAGVYQNALEYVSTPTF